jgi:hypothetical protein
VAAHKTSDESPQTSRFAFVFLPQMRNEQSLQPQIAGHPTRVFPY